MTVKNQFITETQTLQELCDAQTHSIVDSRRALDLVTLGLFSVAIFTSASLLFVIQPMAGKILLPMLGGAPAVWNTCMVFFQATLLAGYLSAHLMTKHLPLRAQILTFAVALLLAMQTLPIAVGDAWVERLLDGASPSVWMLSVLAMKVAPVFFVLSITSPLMQKWFARSGHPQGSDPYFLYGASNIGSILALLLYPFWIEANWGVTSQTERWAMGFGLFTFLATACGIASWYGSRRRSSESELSDSQTPIALATSTASKSIEQRKDQRNVTSNESLPWRRRLYWIALAFVPSSLMLGVTTYISTDASSLPLIWVVPLAMYLLTFVLAFAKRQILPAYWMGRIAALLILAITVMVVTQANDPPAVIVPLHLLMFFTVAMFCHQRLAEDRPEEKYLTDFYLCLSIGGVIGGLFNALLAPALFVTLFEYPLVMVLASLVRKTEPVCDQSTDKESIAGNSIAKTYRCVMPLRVIGFALGLFTMTLVLRQVGVYAETSGWFLPLDRWLPISASQMCVLLAWGIPASLVLRQMESRAYFTAGLLAILSLSVWDYCTDSESIVRGRNFYGTLEIGKLELPEGTVIKMAHGNTVHGWQWTDADRRTIPLSYYGCRSGVGRLIDAVQQQKPSLRVGAIGLGTGTLAASMRPEDSIIYYEINPLVVQYAESHFTFMQDARDRGVAVETRLGDARLVLDDELRQTDTAAGSKYDLLVVDAFSSDSIPIHLITDESMAIYTQHLTSDGVIAMNISNRFLELTPVLARLAVEHGLTGFACYNRLEGIAQGSQSLHGETASLWVIMAREHSDFGTLATAKDLEPLSTEKSRRIWSDDYSNVLSVFQWRM